MPSELRSPRLAVLIDADNASAKIVDGLFEEIAKIGEASVRRIYGDFSNPRSKGWADTLSKHAIIPQQQFAYTTGKNASDITLVIDAMDLLHSGRFDGFCLVSSDSDFTRLAARIRERFHRPAIAIAFQPNGIGSGSGRSIAGVDLADWQRWRRALQRRQRGRL